MVVFSDEKLGRKMMMVLVRIGVIPMFQICVLRRILLPKE
jgi:hypothetical protein